MLSLAIVRVMMSPAARESVATFSRRPVAEFHELPAGQAPRMNDADGHYEITMARQSYAVYRLVK